MRTFAIIFILLLSLPVTQAFAQKKKATAPTYATYPGIPAFDITRADGSIFNTSDVPAGKPALFIFFSTDCSKCRMFVRELQANYQPLRDINIYMATPMAMDGAKIFAHDLGLDYFKNITWGVDAKNFVKPFYDITGLPAAVLYNRDKQLVQRFSGVFTAQNVLQAVEKAR